MQLNQTLDSALLVLALPVPVSETGGIWAIDAVGKSVLGYINADGTGTIYEDGDTLPAIEESYVEVSVTFSPTATGESPDTIGAGGAVLQLSGYSLLITDFYVAEYIAGQGGTISGSKSQVIPLTQSGTTVTAIPAEGYSFYKWSDGVTTASRTDISQASFVVIALFYQDSDDRYIFSQYKE